MQILANITELIIYLSSVILPTYRFLNLEENQFRSQNLLILCVYLSITKTIEQSSKETLK